MQRHDVVSLRAAVVFAEIVCDGIARLITVAPARVSLVGGMPRHIPPMHEVPVAQAIPQRPQCIALVIVSTQVAGVPQAVWPVGQAQAPAVQVWPVGQALPQRPQLALSVIVLTHAPPQIVWLAIAQRHMPAMQA